MTSGEPQTVLFDRYRVEGVLGEGGQAVVFQVFDLRLEIARALKVMLPTVARRKKLRDRFVTEAELLARLEHPNVLRVYDVEVDAPVPFFVAELVTGGSLADRLGEGALPPGLVASAVSQIAAGLAAAHAIGVVHRDVKPQNVLVTPGGVCKLVDFGIAHLEEVARTKAGLAMGTTGFMPPEQVSDAATVDARADVYALAMTAFVLLSARDPVTWLGGDTRGLPPALVPVLLDATAQDRERRTSTVSAFAEAFAAAVATLPPDPPGATLVPAAAGRSAPPAEVTARLTEVRTWFSQDDSTSGSLEGSTRSRPSSSLEGGVRPSMPSVPPGMYTMSRPIAARREESPAWLSKSAAATTPRGFEVRPDPAVVAPEPPPAVPAAAPPSAPPAPATTGSDEDDDGGLPWGLLLVAGAGSAVLLVGVLGLGAVWWQRGRADTALRDEARAHLVHAVRTDLAVVGTLEQLGADPGALSTAVAAFDDARTDRDRAVAAGKLVAHVRAETNRLTDPGSAQRVMLEAQIADMERAVAAWTAVDPQ